LVCELVEEELGFELAGRGGDVVVPLLGLF